MDERKACFLLSCAESVGPKTLEKMELCTGSLAECLLVKPHELQQAGVIDKRQRKELERVYSEQARYEEDYENAIGQGIRILIRHDQEYPDRLRFIPDAPYILFVKGELPGPERPTASIVGARNCSEYGVSAAEWMAGELARCGVDIVSGLAYGIDSAAARGALRAGGRSFAVLGSGIDICYPPANFGLYSQMAGGGGGIVSEFHPGREPLAKHFVMRNRIIAGFGDVLLVIEARIRSGTSLTVDYALNQGKEVFAMPGRINDPLGQGCNRLLRDGATPLTEPGDVLSALGLGDSQAAETIDSSCDVSKLSANERAVYEALDHDSRHIEDISRRSGFDLRLTITLLYALELKGFAMQTMSAYYKKC